MEEMWPGWETVRVIGEGSFGAVYEIKRENFGDTERAAVKKIMIPQKEADIRVLYNSGFDDESVTATFRSYMEDVVREYSLMRKMNGFSNVVNCDDYRLVQHDDGIGWNIYIKMELLIPLVDTLPKRILEQQVVAVAQDMCKALILCKEHDIIHRDIKPENIFVSENGDYKLGDFGIAKTMEKTSGGTKTGTYNYMAPEIYNNQAYNLTADIYSLGMVMYWMLNERRAPFLPLPPAPLKPSIVDKARDDRFRGEPLPMPAHGSEKLKRIVLKACAFRPEDRYPNPREMLDELNELAGGKKLPPVVPVPVPQDADPAEDPNKTVSETEESIRPEETMEAPHKKTSDVPIPGGKKELPKKPKRKWHMICSIGILLLLGLILYGNVHIWTEGDCTNPRKCMICGKTIGEPLGHEWKQETFSTSQTCSRCGVTTDGAMRGQTIDVGEFHTVGLNADGTCIAVGNNSFNQCNVSEWKNIIAVAAGTYHTVGLRTDGTVITAGSNKLNQRYITAGSGWINIVAIDAGKQHTVGLRADGTVVASGDYSYGQCNVSKWRNIVAIAAGESHTVGLRADGTVVAVGKDTDGQCSGVLDWTDIVAITAGLNYTVGLRSDGTVVAVGNNDYGQCDVSDWTNVVSVAAGGNCAVALREDGTVIAVGANKDGQCNVAGWADIVSIAVGSDCTIGLCSDGTVVATGSNDYGQCDVADWKNIRVP